MKLPNINPSASSASPTISKAGHLQAPIGHCDTRRRQGQYISQNDINGKLLRVACARQSAFADRCVDVGYQRPNLVRCVSDVRWALRAFSKSCRDRMPTTFCVFRSTIGTRATPVSTIRSAITPHGVSGWAMICDASESVSASVVPAWNALTFQRKASDRDASPIRRPWVSITG